MMVCQTSSLKTREILQCFVVFWSQHSTGRGGGNMLLNSRLSFSLPLLREARCMGNPLVRLRCMENPLVRLLKISPIQLWNEFVFKKKKKSRQSYPWLNLLSPNPGRNLQQSRKIKVKMLLLFFSVAVENMTKGLFFFFFCLFFTVWNELKL